MVTTYILFAFFILYNLNNFKMLKVHFFVFILDNILICSHKYLQFNTILMAYDRFRCNKLVQN